MRLEGKVAIVAGAAWGGIGGATALRFAQEGAKIVVSTRRRREKLEETVARIEAAGGEACDEGNRVFRRYCVSRIERDLKVAEPRFTKGAFGPPDGG